MTIYEKPSPDRYYPVSTQALTNANEDVNTLRRTNSPEMVHGVITALSAAYRRHEADEPSCPNPYLEIYQRCAALGREVLERAMFEAEH